MESYFHRFQKYEHAGINLHPVDPNNPRLGGKVVANIKQFDVRTFSFGTKSYFGVYGEDFMTFGQFAADAHYPIDHEETLLKIMEDENEVVIDKHTFRFENNRVTYSRKVNGEVVDTEIEHAIEQSELTPNVDESWSESFFYGVGNKNMWMHLLFDIICLFKTYFDNKYKMSNYTYRLRAPKGLDDTLIKELKLIMGLKES